MIVYIYIYIYKIGFGHGRRLARAWCAQGTPARDHQRARLRRSACTTGARGTDTSGVIADGLTKVRYEANVTSLSLAHTHTRTHVW